jgi:hypothetical protein
MHLSDDRFFEIVGMTDNQAQPLGDRRLHWIH